MRQSTNNNSSVIRIRVSNYTLDNLPEDFNITSRINEYLATFTTDNAHSSNEGKNNGSTKRN